MKHEFVTCDKVGCEKRIEKGETYWGISCNKLEPDSIHALAGAMGIKPASKNLHLCLSCYEDVCAFINDKGEVKHG